MNSEHLHPEGRPFTKDEFVEKIKNDKNFANRFGNLGRIYGAQWRSWKNPSFPKISKEFSDICDGRTHIEVDYPIDQISELITQLKENPDSRRLMVNAWAVHDLPNMVLPPCHYGFQVYTRELSLNDRFLEFEKRDLDHSEFRRGGNYGTVIPKERTLEVFDKYNIPTRAISLMFNMRSVDTFLGLPFNIASYGLLLEIIAKEVNMVPDELIGNLGDVHLYSNHIEQAKEQIGREMTLWERTNYGIDVLGYNGLLDYGHSQNDDDKILEFLEMCGDVPTRTREPFPLPTLKNLPNYRCMEPNWKCYEIEDIRIDNYESHPTIKAPLSN